METDVLSGHTFCPISRTRKGAELRKRVSVCQRSAQGALAPQRPPAQQADPLTAHPKIVKATGLGWSFFLLTSHGVEPERARPLSQIESTLGIGETVSTLLEFLLVCLHATLELFCILGRR